MSAYVVVCLCLFSNAGLGISAFMLTDLPLTQFSHTISAFNLDGFKFANPAAHLDPALSFQFGKMSPVDGPSQNWLVNQD